jgi:hypothetical protein
VLPLGWRKETNCSFIHETSILIKSCYQFLVCRDARLTHELTNSAIILSQKNLPLQSIIGSGSLFGNNIDKVANFKVASIDAFKTGTKATTLNALNIATADVSTQAAAIATAAGREPPPCFENKKPPLQNGGFLFSKSFKPGSKNCPLQFQYC